MTYRTRIKYTAAHDCMDAGGRTNQETESKKQRCGIAGNVVNPLKPLAEYLIDRLHPYKLPFPTMFITNNYY
jgi:hypothetical protein